MTASLGLEADGTRTKDGIGKSEIDSGDGDIGVRSTSKGLEFLVAPSMSSVGVEVAS